MHRFVKSLSAVGISLILLAGTLSGCLALREADETPLFRVDSYGRTDTRLTQSGNAEKTDPDVPESEPAESESPETEPAEPKTPETDPEPEIPPEPADPYADVSIHFLAAGDNLIHENIYTDARTRGSAEKEYDFLPMYADVADFIAAADIAFINQETVMAGADYGYSAWPCFNSPQQLGRDLVTLGFDIVNLANNHMLDKGASGLSSTLDFWDEQAVLTLGGYRDEADADTVRVLEQDGVKLAFLSYTLHTNGIVKNESSPLVIPYIDDARIVSDLARAREAGDFVIVSIHWGDENTQEPNDEQRRLAKLIADNGADVILGHHSHTVQPIEWMESESGKQVLCIYSLGNFVSGMARPVNQVGGFLTFTIESDGEGGLRAAEPLFTPTVFWYGMDWYNTHLYFMDAFTDALAYGHGTAISGYSMTVSSARAFITDTIAAEFLPTYLK